MTRQGLDIREHAEAEFASAIRLSPNGDYIAYLDSHQVYLTPAVLTSTLRQLDAPKPAFVTRQLSKTGGTFLCWSANGETLNWSTGPQLKTVAPDTALESGQEGETPQAIITDLSIRVSSEAPKTKIALINARIITMNDEREVYERGTVLINGNRIEGVGPSADINIPGDYRQLDATGKTIIPGLIDAHAHAPYGYQDIIPQQNWKLLAHLALGVTTMQDPAGKARTTFASAEYARSGRILAPRIFSTGEIVYGARSVGWAPIDNLEDALAHVRRLKAQGATSIKNYNQPRREQRQQVNEAALQGGLMSFAEGGSLFHMDMNLIADGVSGIEHNIPVLNLYEDVLQFWEASGAGYTPTLVVTYGGLTSEDYYYQQSEVWKHPLLSEFVPPKVLQSRSVRRPMAPEEDYRDDLAAATGHELMKRGIAVNIGAHGQREGLAAHWEMWSFARGGFSPMEALATATIDPAHHVGLANELGSLEQGKLADLLILDANPLEDIHNTDDIDRVVLNGRIYRAKDLSEEYSGDKKLAPLYWQDRQWSNIR